MTFTKSRYSQAKLSIISDEWQKTLGQLWLSKKFAIHVAILTIHEVGVRNRPDFSDKLVEDWRWQKR